MPRPGEAGGEDGGVAAQQHPLDAPQRVRLLQEVAHGLGAVDAVAYARSRGVDFDVPRLYVLDGGKALHAVVRKMAGRCALVQRGVIALHVTSVTDYHPDRAGQPLRVG